VAIFVAVATALIACFSEFARAAKRALASHYRAIHYLALTKLAIADSPAKKNE
jgi:hypothetical protein